jgi:alkaline phosphatase
LPGLDVLIGTGWGESVDRDKVQGENFVPGNRYISDADFEKIDVQHGGHYRIVQRTAGTDGHEVLAKGAALATQDGSRLFGFFGAGKKSHLPFSTADGNFDPTVGVGRTAEKYTSADLRENPRLTDFALAALELLSQNRTGFWLMIEAGDVDWANHDNNIDNSIGAVLDGDSTVRAVTDWIEAHGGWDDTVLIVTADHGHYFHLSKPEVIATATKQK